MTLPTRPFAWEKSYPPGVSWDAPLAIGTINQILPTSVARFGDLPAIRYGDRVWSYRAFAELVGKCAGGLKALGVKKGVRVALYLPNTPWHPLMFYAVLRLGGVVVHLSPLDAEREIIHKLKDAGARIVVTTDLGTMAGAAEKLAKGLGDADIIDTVILGEDAFWRGGDTLADGPAAGGRILSGAALVDGGVAVATAVPVVPDDVAVLQFTGGTTGLPKAAQLTHGNFSAAVEIYKAWSEPQGMLHYGKEKVLCVLPLFHIYALTAVLLLGMTTGSEIHLHPRFDIAAVVDAIETHGITSFPGVPTMWIALANFPGIETRNLSSLRLLRSGGAACPIEIEARIKGLTGQRLGGGWGMTETAPAGTNVPTYGPDRYGTIGLPLPGIVMDIVAIDDPRRVLPPGEIGEIRIKGPNVITGYLNRPEENAKAFVDGYLLTGDMGFMDEDGFFTIVDRKKDMIISGGFNVYPRAIEEAIYEHPSVAEVIVIGVPDDYRGEAAKAFVTLKPGARDFDLAELRTFLATRIGKHEMPAHLEFRDVLPKTAVGKLSKKELVAEERQKRSTSPART
ncbi:MAG TPA: AMP-binding protein [Hyphomicrobiaceae bacterium]|mgnify:CR=1 FL=1|nr:AMP-binding protein [Hyphomicrobiaceae bacterium]